MDCLYRINHIKLVLFSDRVLIFYVTFSIDRDCVFQSSTDSEKKIPMKNSKKKKSWINGKICKNNVRNTRVRESEEKKWEHEKNTRTKIKERQKRKILKT